jgi:hypothetical protein
MNAQVVWNVWRRILREPELQHVLFTPGDAPPELARFGLDASQREVALAYAQQGDRAQWFVTNYRFRLANSFLNALETGAPLTLRALLGNGVDLMALSHAFLDRHEWKDYGPYVYTYCRDALRFVAEQPEVAGLAGFLDLLALERQAVDWMIELGSASQLSGAASHGVGTLERTTLARYHCSSSRLSNWLRDKTQLGKVPLEAGVEHYFIYLPDLCSTVRFMRVPPRAAAIYEALGDAQPRTALPGLLIAAGHAGHTGQDDECLAVLERCNAVRPHTGAVST